MSYSNSPHPDPSWDYAGVHLPTERSRATLSEAIARINELDCELPLLDFKGAIALKKGEIA